MIPAFKLRRRVKSAPEVSTHLTGFWSEFARFPDGILGMG